MSSIKLRHCEYFRAEYSEEQYLPMKFSLPKNIRSCERKRFPGDLLETERPLFVETHAIFVQFESFNNSVVSVREKFDIVSMIFAGPIGKTPSSNVSS